MFKRLKTWLLDRRELAEHRASASYYRRIECDLAHSVHDLAEAQVALTKAEHQVFIFKGLLQHLAIVSADVAKCKSTCKLCKGLLAQPLFLAHSALICEEKKEVSSGLRKTVEN